MKKLTFKQLREANIERVKLYPSKFPMDANFYKLALYGEVGELCNFIKKEHRDGKDYTKEIAKEIADIVIYTDLLVYTLGRAHLRHSPPASSFNELKIVPFENAPPGTIELSVAIAEMATSIGFGSAYVEVFLRGLCRLAKRKKIDINEAIIDKFNEVSNKIGVPVFL